MKGNFYILALTTVLAHNSFAFDIQKGTILESKKWTTGNGSLQIVDALLEKQNILGKLFPNKMKSLKNQSTIENAIRAQAQLYGMPSVVLPGEIVKGYAYSNIGLVNNSDSTKTYKILMEHCLHNPQNESDDCFKTKFTLQLEPKAKLEDIVNYESIMFAAGNAGSYHVVQSKITIDSIENSTHFEAFTQTYIPVSDLVLSEGPLPLPQK